MAQTRLPFISERGKEKVDQSGVSSSHAALQLDEVWKKISSNKKRLFQGQAYCTIFEVPPNIRKHDAQAYQPTMVAIGPYHRKKSGILVTEGDKWRCIRFLLYKYSPKVNMNKLLRSWIEIIKQQEELAWSCYSGDAGMDSYSFMEMLLLDGCFILHVLLMNLQTKETEETGDSSEDENNTNSDANTKDDEEIPLVIMPWQQKPLKMDLLLLENQIPFFIIENLFSQIEDSRIKSTTAAHLALILFEGLYPGKDNDIWKSDRISLTSTPNGDKTILHLLHLFRHALLQTSNHKMTDTKSWVHGLNSISPELQIPSATELAESGVQFRSDLERSFLDIDFRNGELQIPRLYISDHSNALFWNLIAFEQCSGVTPHITAYTTFMARIIHSERDVRLLHQRGAVVNMLSTDEDIALFFKKICYHYQAVKPLLQERTRRKIHELQGCGKDELSKIMDYASLPHFCKREGSGSSRYSSSGSDDCFSLDHPFHQQLYSYIKRQAADRDYTALLKQGSFHVDGARTQLRGDQDRKNHRDRAA